MIVYEILQERTHPSAHSAYHVLSLSTDCRTDRHDGNSSCFALFHIDSLCSDGDSVRTQNQICISSCCCPDFPSICLHPLQYNVTGALYMVPDCFFNRTLCRMYHQSIPQKNPAEFLDSVGFCQITFSYNTPK